MGIRVKGFMGLRVYGLISLWVAFCFKFFFVHFPNLTEKPEKVNLIL